MPTTIDLLEQINWDFPESETSESISSLHPYPAKFIQEIPRSLIKILGVPRDTWVLDPFCGSGATLTEAQSVGFPAIGIDLNPIACMISRVKTQPIKGDVIDHAKHVVKLAQSTKDFVIPEIPNLNHWFKAEAQEVIARLLSQINIIDDLSVREALRLSLSGILVRVSNQESDTRYAAIEKNINAQKLYAMFITAVERLAQIKRNYKPQTWDVDVICQDILKVQPHHIKHPIGLAITSPPYPNAYEYWLYHKYRMFWLGYDPITVKEQEIGARAHYFKKNRPTVDDFRYQMKHVLGLMWTSLVKNGHACVVIGRSKIHGEIVDNASIMVDLAQSIGFDVVANLPRTLAPSRKTFNLSHANIRTENLLIFKKCSNE
jgi:DNA modification methylase